MTLCFGWDKSERGHNSITKKQSEWHKNCGAKFASSTINGGNWATCTCRCRIHCCQPRNIDGLDTVWMKKHLPKWFNAIQYIVWLKYEGIKDQKKCVVLIFSPCVMLLHVYWCSHYQHKLLHYVVMLLVWTRLKEQSSVTLGLIVDHLI